MSKIRACLFFILMLFTFSMSAQIPFAMPGQIPVVLNPSMAGSRNKIRLSTSYNNFRTDKKRENNFCLSMDKAIKNSGFGYGIYYLYRNNNTNPIETDWYLHLPENTISQDYTGNLKQHTAGIALAPKYNVYSKIDPKVVRLSISPSLFFEYQNKRSTVYEHYSRELYTKTLFNSNNPDGTTSSTDSSVTKFVKQEIRNNIFKAGMGLLINTSNILFFFRLSHETDIAAVQINRYSFNSGLGSGTYLKASIKETLYSIDESAGIGISIPKRKDPLISFTPLASIGVKQYINLKSGKSSDTENIYSANLSDRKKFDFAYLHFSANLRVWKILTGATYTKSYQNNYSGINAGYQNSRIKMIYTFYFGNVNFNEVSAVFIL